MKFLVYLLLAGLVFAIFKTCRTVGQSQSAAERFFAIRASAFTWMVGLVLLTAFLFIPLPQRLLFLPPAFFAVVSLAKFWRSGRERLRRDHQNPPDIEKMKRVN